MASATIPVDLFNPGQVFACLGLAEAAEVFCGGVSVTFRGDGATVDFTLEAEGADDPIATVLSFLAEAEVSSEAPAGDEALSTEKWKVPTEVLRDGAPYPYPCPSSPATLRAVLSGKERRIAIDHWGDATRRDNVKFWAGSGGYPGAGLLRDALDLIRGELQAGVVDPFAIQSFQSSSFRFDWRRDYIPLGIGFSLNNHGKILPVGYPVVEVLAAIGMSHARPLRFHKLHYRYAVPMAPALPLSLFRAALGCAPLPFSARVFNMTLDWPGQENQARCITNVTEEI